MSSLHVCLMPCNMDFASFTWCSELGVQYWLKQCQKRCHGWCPLGIVIKGTVFYIVSTPNSYSTYNCIARKHTQVYSSHRHVHLISAHTSVRRFCSDFSSILLLYCRKNYAYVLCGADYIISQEQPSTKDCLNKRNT